MRKTSIFLIIALALLASLAMTEVNVASAQTKEPVGVVVDYVPGQSITIEDQQGNQSQYALSPSLKILPPGRANTLAVGSFVTIIAPASIDKGKQTAVGIVIHPKVPDGWKAPKKDGTPGTPGGTDKVTPTGTLPTETPTPFESPTPVGTLTMTETATPTPFGAVTDTPTPAPKTPDFTNTSFIEWLRSLFLQVLSKQ